MSQPNRRDSRSGLAVVAVVAGVNVLLLVLLVLAGVRNEEPPAYSPSPVQPRPAAGRLVGPELVTVDATSPDEWRFFSFDQASLVPRPGPTDWDLAFRRFEIIANGGDGFAGSGGVLDLGERTFDEVQAVPASGYIANSVGSDTLNSAVRKWYDYSFLSHILSPKPRVYAVRTADGRFAKLQFVGYYCPGATPGCITFRYVYQSAGGRSLVDPTLSSTTPWLRESAEAYTPTACGGACAGWNGPLYRPPTAFRSAGHGGIVSTAYFSPDRSTGEVRRVEPRPDR